MCIILRRDNDEARITWSGNRCVEVLGYHFDDREKHMLFNMLLQNLEPDNYLEVLHIGNTKLEIQEPSFSSLRHQDEPPDSCILSSVYKKGYKKTDKGLKKIKELSPWDTWYSIKEQPVTIWPQEDENANLNSFKITYPKVEEKNENEKNYFPFKVWQIGPFTNPGYVLIALKLTFKGETFQKLITDRTLYNVDGQEPLLTAIRQNLIPFYSKYTKGEKKVAQDQLKKFNNYIDFSSGYDLIFIKHPQADEIIPFYSSSVYKAELQPKPEGIAERFITTNPFYQIYLKNDRKIENLTQEKHLG